MIHIALLVGAAACIVLAGLLSCADAALAFFSPARAGELAAAGRGGAKALVRLVEDRARYLNTALLLRTLAEVAGIVMVALDVYDLMGKHWWPAAGIVIGVMVVISFVAIGVAPRTVGRQHAETVALIGALPLVALASVLGPIPNLLILIGNALTPGRGFREGPFSTETELREMVDLAEDRNLIDDDEREMIHSVLELAETRAREVMVPRGDIVFVERHKNLRQTMSLFLRSGFSRVPVIEDSLDHIVGFAYLKDIVRRDFEAPDVEKTQRVEELMRPVTYIPDSKKVDELLQEMQRGRQHIAIVVDEYGGTAGLITIEDILEEIVGEIADEYDRERPPVEWLGDGSARVSARLSVEELEELFDVSIDAEDVETVGGLLAHQLGKVPIAGSVATVSGLRMTAENLTGRRNRIGTVTVRRLDDAGQPEAGTQVASKQAGDSHAVAGTSRNSAGNGVVAGRQPPE